MKLNINIIINWSDFNYSNIIFEHKKLYSLWDITKISYWNIVLYAVIALFITSLMVILSETLSLTTLKNQAQLSEYECGFEPFAHATRAPFEIHFYVVGILFLIFDVEIALLYPWIFSLQSFTWNQFLIGYFFIFILGLGFSYELKMKVLEWKQNNEDLIPTPSLYSINRETTFVESRKFKSIFLFKKLPISLSPSWKPNNQFQKVIENKEFKSYRTINSNNWFRFKKSSLQLNNYWNLGGIGGGINHNVWWNNPMNIPNAINKPVHKFEVSTCKVDAYYNALGRDEKINLAEKPTFTSCWCIKCQSRYWLHGCKE